MGASASLGEGCRHLHPTPSCLASRSDCRLRAGMRAMSPVQKGLQCVLAWSQTPNSGWNREFSVLLSLFI